ncbi:MAG: guanylate kinase [archaeon]|jgi:guanylate kinase
MAKPKLFIITGTSGAGKTTISNAIVSKVKNITKVITCTTRPMRKGEKDGVDYRFFTKEKFESFIRKDMLVEYAKVYDNYYGSLRSDVEDAMESKKSVLLSVNVAGALTFSAKFRGAITIFIKTPTLEILRQRLEARGKNTPEEINKRIELAREELTFEKRYTHIVVNDKLKDAIDEVKQIVLSAVKD